MRVTFPHMGHLSIALETIFKEIGVQMVVPPPISPNTVSIGAGKTPEGCCLPFKVVVGNLAEGLRQGADTIVMLGGDGPCRFGYFGRLAETILRDQGFVFSTIILEGEDITGQIGSLRKAFGVTRRDLARAVWQGWRKLKALDEIERLVHLARPGEVLTGRVSMEYRLGVEAIRCARDAGEVERAVSQVRQRLIFHRPPRGKGLRIGLVGDIYMLLEPAVNYGLEEYLEKMGVTTHRSIYISEWVLQHLWPHKNRQYRKELLEVAGPYLSSVVGGHGLDSVANTIRYAQAGYDGVIHVFPLTCMPEIVARSILGKVAGDLNIPLLTLVLDEHSGIAGVLSRLEAFVDILQLRQNTNKFFGGRASLTKSTCEDKIKVGQYPTPEG